MKKIFISIVMSLALISSTCLFAQVTIGSSSNSLDGALLDLKEFSDNEAITGGRTAQRGLGVPRVVLQDAHNLFPMFDKLENDKYLKEGSDMGSKSTLDADHTGLLVYGSLRSQFCTYISGIYVWSGDEWKILGAGKQEVLEDIDDILGYGTYENISWEVDKNHVFRIKGAGALPANIPLGGCVKYIKHAIVEDGITSFAYGSHFRGYDELISVSLPESLNKPSSISSSFSSNPKLEVVNFPSKMDSMRFSQSFLDNPLLKEVKFPQAMSFLYLSQSIRGANLEKIEFPQSVDSMYISQSIVGSKLNSIKFPTSGNLYSVQSFDSLKVSQLKFPTNGKIRIGQSFHGMTADNVEFSKSDSVSVSQSFNGSKINSLAFLTNGKVHIGQSFDRITADIVEFSKSDNVYVSQSFFGSKINSLGFLTNGKISISQSFRRESELKSLTFSNNVSDLSIVQSFEALLRLDYYKFPTIGKLYISTSFSTGGVVLPPNRY